MSEEADLSVVYSGQVDAVLTDADQSQGPISLDVLYDLAIAVGVNQLSTVLDVGCATGSRAHAAGCQRAVGGHRHRLVRRDHRVGRNRTPYALFPTTADAVSRVRSAPPWPVGSPSPAASTCTSTPGPSVPYPAPHRAYRKAGFTPPFSRSEAFSRADTP